MACRGCLECLLKLLNFLLTLVGLSMVGYGIYLFVEWKRLADHQSDISPSADNHEFVQLGRPMLLAISLSGSILDKLPKAWFIYLFLGIGVVLILISCFGCIGAATRNGCCLSCYSFLLVLLILAELGCAAFIFFDKSWKDAIPTDKTGDFDMIYGFLDKNWKIAKWVALGAVILELLTWLEFGTVLSLGASFSLAASFNFALQQQPWEELGRPISFKYLTFIHQMILWRAVLAQLLTWLEFGAVCSLGAAFGLAASFNFALQ